MKQTIDYIRSELKGLYPPEEIEQFIVILFREICNYSRADLIIYKNSILSESLATQFRRFTTRLKAYEPIQYILGKADFYDQTFIVHPGVLIPRPETEELIELICKNTIKGNAEILDIGTGSGCIAISLANHIAGSRVTALDVSEEALTIAKENSVLNKATIQFIKEDILQMDPTAFTNKFDIVVSNPPYVCESEKAEMHENVLQYEPHLALFVSDSDPLLFYRTIAEKALTLLQKGGTLYFEINALFGEETRQMLSDMGYKEILIIKDMFGKDRFTKATRE